MRTPAGKECRFYYQDYNRGRNVQECRLVTVVPGKTLPWKINDCQRCPIPDILNANASSDLALELTIQPQLFGLGRKIMVGASCTRHHIEIKDPYIGCPQCNAEKPGLDRFIQALEQDEHE
ncbi:MAG: hypothetical protein UZ15_CFX003002975 [Chloroflexi bacterium OLB15]|nr:MAG: hypothetical protein UZ15_CFX003002975 [Chloroflexi bacterium OLB15]